MNDFCHSRRNVLTKHSLTRPVLVTRASQIRGITNSALILRLDNDTYRQSATKQKESLDEIVSYLDTRGVSIVDVNSNMSDEELKTSIDNHLKVKHK